MSGGSASSSLTVAVRIRPLNEAEKQKKYFSCASVLDDKRVLLVDPEKFEDNILRQNRQHERTFTFDAAFGQQSTHEEVHGVTTAPLVDMVVDGYNATVFAYGPTGSGKTFTMVGNEQTPGLMMLLTRGLYDKINPSEFNVYLSYLEIYNEVIRDLLNPNAGVLDLLEDDRGNVQVPGLSRVKAPDTNRIMQILQEGNSRRTQEPTAANSTSSRSHALLQVTLYKNSVQHGKLFLIDLAGSERASQTQNQGQRLKEGAAINRSLLALGNVINALSTGNKGRYVNYRDSKLTRLLKDSLGGNSTTCMIAHITPSSANYDETYNTLVYASRAKNITNRIMHNRPASADQQYAEALKEMRKEANKKNNIHHSVSNQQLSLKEGERSSLMLVNEPGRSMLRWNAGGVSAPNDAEGNRHFSSLFNSLKSQYLANTEKQNKMREKLLKANHEACDIEMSRSAKLAILMAWEAHNQEEKEKYHDIIERFKTDVNTMDDRLSQLHEIRQKIEKAIRKLDDTANSLESRMLALAKDSNQREVIDLMIKMAAASAQKIALYSDYVLQKLRIQRQENSLLKVHKYEQIADKLINNEFPDGEREKLNQEYKVVKNQLNYHLIPLKNDMAQASWNSELLAATSSRKSFGKSLTDRGNPLNAYDDKSYPATAEDDQPRARKKRNSTYLPKIDKNNFSPDSTFGIQQVPLLTETVKLPPL